MAPYFGPADRQTSSLGAIFTSMTQTIQGMDMVFQDFRRLVDQYGIEIAAYEGGQSLTGTQDQTLKHLSQHDIHMYAAYLDFFALWRMRFGNATFMHFSLAGTAGIPESIFQYSYWGSIPSVLEDPVACGRNLQTLTGTETIDSVRHACPKYRALFEQAAN